jgi:DNA polymerase-3 subunit beta
VLIERVGGNLSFLATDIEIQITAKSGLEAAAESHSITVGARKLLDILRALPDSAEVTLQQQDKRLLVKAGRSRFSLQSLPAEDFPKLAKPAGEAARFKLEQKALRRLLSLVQYAMAQQDIRYYLNGMLLVVDGATLQAVATDGHRLSWASLAIGGSYTRQEVILPRKTVLELSKLLEDNDAPLVIDILANQARFRFGNVELVSKVVDGKFPDYNRVIPAGHTKRVELDRATLLSALQRAAILSNEKFRGVRLVLAAEQLRIVCTNSEQEEAEEELPIDYSGEGLDIGFNITYLLDVLSNVASDRVFFAFGDANSSALVTLPEREDYKYVVMPMRI